MDAFHKLQLRLINKEIKYSKTRRRLCLDSISVSRVAVPGKNSNPKQFNALIVNPSGNHNIIQLSGNRTMSSTRLRTTRLITGGLLTVSWKLNSSLPLTNPNYHDGFSIHKIYVINTFCNYFFFKYVGCVVQCSTVVKMAWNMKWKRCSLLWDESRSC